MMNSAETPHFFKIILENTTQFNKLRIPRKFVRNYGSELSGTVQLTVPDGGFTLPVEVAKSENGEVWLEKGWQQFSEHYSFKLGYFLVFEYEGNGSFQVLPFDLSFASKAEYPYISDSNDGSDKECLQPNKEEEAKVAKPKEIVSAEILNRTPQCLEEAKDDSFNGILNQSPPDGKTGKTTSDKGLFEGLKPCTRKRRGMGDGLECPKMFQRLTAKEKAQTLEIANSFNSKNPFFVAVVRPCYTINRMIIPDYFYVKFFSKTHGCKATLCLPNGKSWSVNYYRSNPNNDRNPKVRFSSGWRKFALDNRLVVGDICVFELLEAAAEMSTLKVVIHRFGEDVANCGTSQAPEAAARISNIASEIPSFTKTIRATFLDYHAQMWIPFRFIEKHFKPDVENVVLQVADKSWFVKLSVYKDVRMARLASGWMRFARENSLKVGDVCVFKMITSSNDAMPMLNVSISRSDG